jgi:hypothetical protein
VSHSVPDLGPTVLGKLEILSYLGEVADELASRHMACRVVVVGGSYLALHDLRESTADVDSVSKLTDEVRAVVREVGERHGLRADWLNDSAMTFAPAGLNLDECELLFEHHNLTVLGPSPDAQAAVDAYYLAYPFEEHDPHLVDYVQQIADQSTQL